MKKQEVVCREIACSFLKGSKSFTQLELSKRLGFSLSTINGAVSRLESVNAVRIRQRAFEVISLSRLLAYLATHRNLEKDIAYTTRVKLPVKEIEAGMPNGIAFTAYTGYKLLFNDVPADYSEVYLYSTASALDEIKRRFKKENGPPNLFVLTADSRLAGETENGEIEKESACAAQVFVDLWNIKMWYAKDFADALAKKLGI